MNQGERVNQGERANRNGKILEDTVIPALERNGYAIFMNSAVEKKPELIYELDKYVLKNVPYVTIYNSDGRTELVIVNKVKDRCIRVEMKYQMFAGSVDEKYPYMFLNAIYKYPEKEIIFLVDGGGYKPGAREWIQKMIDSNWLDYKSRGKEILLMNLSEFIIFVNSELS